MNRRPAYFLFTVVLLLSVVTLVLSNYYSIPANAFRPLAVVPCAASITQNNGNQQPDIELSPWSGPPGTPVTVTGCGFESTDATCTISSTPGTLFTGTAPCIMSGGSLFGSFTVKSTPDAAGGPYLVTATNTGGSLKSANAIFQVAFASTTISTTTSTSTLIISTSYSTLTTTTSFFSSLTTTTVATTMRSTETDNFISYLTNTAATSQFSTISTTVTATTTALATTLTTSTVYSTTVTTVTGFIARLAQLLTGSPEVLGILALFLLIGPMVARRFFD